MRTSFEVVAISVIVLVRYADSAIDEVSWNYPDVSVSPADGHMMQIHCDDNAIVSAWCDSHIFPELQCALLPHFNAYSCSCNSDAALCPDECIGWIGGESNGFDTSVAAPIKPILRTQTSIRCFGIPNDEPNYILKDSQRKSSRTSSNYHHSTKHTSKGCQNNAIVSSWCDESINPHLQCYLNPGKDQYKCHCSGKHSYCPSECIGGSKPILQQATASVIVCSGIPEDNPNYILKED
jgi:hypothetical protein